MSGQLLVRPAGQPGRDAPAGPARPSPTAARSCGSSTSAPSAGWPWSTWSTASPCRSRTSAATRSTRSSTTTPGSRRCADGVPGSSAPCSTSRWPAASATSTPTRRCGGPGCTGPGRPTRLPRPKARLVLDAARAVMVEALEAGRHLVRLALRQRQRGERLLRPPAARLRPHRRAVRPLRVAGGAGGVHEPLVVPVPALPAASPPGPLVVDLRCPRAGPRVGVGGGAGVARAAGRLRRVGSCAPAARAAADRRDRAAAPRPGAPAVRGGGDEPDSRAGHRRVDRPAGARLRRRRGPGQERAAPRRAAASTSPRRTAR